MRLKCNLSSLRHFGGYRENEIIRVNLERNQRERIELRSRIGSRIECLTFEKPIAKFSIASKELLLDAPSRRSMALAHSIPVHSSFMSCGKIRCRTQEKNLPYAAFSFFNRSLAAFLTAANSFLIAASPGTNFSAASKSFSAASSSLSPALACARR